ncbi:MAG: hypothetical protein ACXVIJ_04030 [Thermoanaerobaculia bacterium]
MKRLITIALVVSGVITASVAEARVVVRGPRGHVVLRAGFPIRRALPDVVVRPGVTVRVAPSVYLGPVVFAGVAVRALPPANVRVWNSNERIDREDGWTDLTMDVDRRGSRLMMEIDKGPAQISFAEVVFENGETQVVDFNERVQGRGIYTLLDFRDGRKIDHVRLVARATRAATDIRLHLVS